MPTCTVSGVSHPDLDAAIRIIVAGGVIAYPTEYCFGLGCDPRNAQAIRRILAIKRRSRDQGLIMVAAAFSQLLPYVDSQLFEDEALLNRLQSSWPGPVTWLLPAVADCSRWIRGQHDQVAVRISRHPLVSALCRRSGRALVSTSANRHGSNPLRSATHVEHQLGGEVDFVLTGRCSGADTPTPIIDGRSCQVLRH